MPPAKVTRIASIGLVVRDLDAAAAFYEGALGFTGVGETEAAGVRTRRLRLGRQHLDLLAFEAPGAPYPASPAANDPWFQHFAIAVGDMAAAYAHLSRYDHQPISEGGPQPLPPSTGSVIAYKFRDPEGHPLELSFIPGSDWTRRPGGPFLGIDHSAIAVADLAASIAFYEGLGLRVGGRGVNQGPEQDRLDGLPDVVLDIVSMTTSAAGPHLELLHYRSPRSAQPPRTFAPADVAATRLTFMGDAAPGLMPDPDGHLLDVVTS